MVLSPIFSFDVMPLSPRQSAIGNPLQQLWQFFDTKLGKFFIARRSYELGAIALATARVLLLEERVPRKLGANGFPTIFVLLVGCLYTVGQGLIVVGLAQRWKREPSYCYHDQNRSDFHRFFPSSATNPA
jgi:hypothetical protein